MPRIREIKKRRYRTRILQTPSTFVRRSLEFLERRSRSAAADKNPIAVFAVRKGQSRSSWCPAPLTHGIHPLSPSTERLPVSLAAGIPNVDAPGKFRGGIHVHTRGETNERGVGEKRRGNWREGGFCWSDKR